jgi:hypothetical protein
LTDVSVELIASIIRAVMKAVSSSETAVTTYTHCPDDGCRKLLLNVKTMWHNFPEDSHLDIHASGFCLFFRQLVVIC